MAGSDARHSLNRRRLLSLLGGHALLVAGCRRSRATRSIQQAIDAALGYVQRTELQGLECTSERTGASTRLHRQGVVFVASFIARAAGDLLTAEQRARLASRVRRLFREDGWGYSVNAPVDSDDTAFAVHTLLDLGEDTDSDAVVDGLAALRRFQAPGNGWFNTFRDSTESRIARRGGAAENAYVHLGVNANVLSLLDRLGQLTPDAALRLLGECRDVASCRSFYYPFEMYTLSLLLPLSAVAQHPHAHALAQEIAGKIEAGNPARRVTFSFRSPTETTSSSTTSSGKPAALSTLASEVSMATSRPMPRASSICSSQTRPR